MTTASLLNKLRSISMEAAWAVLYERGFQNCFISGLEVLQPERIMVGRARTMRYVPFRPDLASELEPEGPQLHKEVVEQSKQDDILVVDSFGCRTAGFAGDIILTRFVKRGGSGVTVDGSVRDLSFLKQIQLPVYTRATHAAYSLNQIIALEENIPVQIDGVCVLPGDYLFGDGEGVLVIPQNIITDILEEASDIDRKERFIRSKLESGASLQEAYPLNDKLLTEFELWKRTRDS